MVDEATRTVAYGRDVPVAPLGGVLLVKTKAGRLKDEAAIEQAAEHLPTAELQAAVAWAEREDAATGEDLASLIKTAPMHRMNSGVTDTGRTRTA